VKQIFLMLIIFINTGLIGQQSSLTSTTTEKKIQDLNMFLQADTLHRKRRYGEANKLYTDLISREASDGLYFGYTRFLSDLNQSQKIIDLYEKTSHLFKKDPEMGLLNVRSYLNKKKPTKKDLDQAKQILDKIKKEHPHNRQIVYYLAAYYERTKEPKKAIAHLNEFINKNRRQKTGDKRKYYYLKQKSSKSN